jgi:hypothetical protein
MINKDGWYPKTWVGAFIVAALLIVLLVELPMFIAITLVKACS